MRLGGGVYSEIVWMGEICSEIVWVEIYSETGWGGIYSEIVWMGGDL